MEKNLPRMLAAMRLKPQELKAWFSFFLQQIVMSF
jgi:hypothetical protein